MISDNNKKFEDTKGVIRSLNSTKDRQCNCSNKKYKRENTDLQNITQEPHEPHWKLGVNSGGITRPAFAEGNKQKFWKVGSCKSGVNYAILGFSSHTISVLKNVVCQKDIHYAYAGRGWRSLEQRMEKKLFLDDLTNYGLAGKCYFPFIYEELLSIFLAKRYVILG